MFDKSAEEEFKDPVENLKNSFERRKIVKEMHLNADKLDYKPTIFD